METDDLIKRVASVLMPADHQKLIEIVEQRRANCCIYPGCVFTRRTRGLCHGHYQTMRSYVRLGRADERDLERRGLLLPEGTGGSKITTGYDAFIKGSKVTGRGVA